MVKLTLTSALAALVTAMAVSAAPGAGTYFITHSLEGNLTLSDKNSASLYPPEWDSGDVEAEQWALEPKSGSNTFAFKNVKYGTYLGYDSAKPREVLKAMNKPTSFALVEGAKDTYYIALTGKDRKTGLVLNSPPLNRFGGPVSVMLEPREGSDAPWKFTPKKPAKANSRPQGAAAKPSGCGAPTQPPRWMWPN
ncbi:hypothetical protein FRC07_001054 [Ceratobasidium sp. 392]|nr:hypothetical protein FRC07_001054 [Ceratobasidium sp. 392]